MARMVIATAAALLLPQSALSTAQDTKLLFGDLLAEKTGPAGDCDLVLPPTGLPLTGADLAGLHRSSRPVVILRDPVQAWRAHQSWRSSCPHFLLPSDAWGGANQVRSVSRIRNRRMVTLVAMPGQDSNSSVGLETLDGLRLNFDLEWVKVLRDQRSDLSAVLDRRRLPVRPAEWKSVSVGFAYMGIFVRRFSDPPAGVDIDLWEALAGWLGLRLSLLRVDNYRQLIKLFDSDLVDVAISGMSVSSSRLRAAEPVATLPRRIVFTVRKPLPRRPGLSTLTGPLRPGVWLAVAVLSLSVSSALLAFGRASGETAFEAAHLSGFVTLSVLLMESLPPRYHQALRHLLGGSALLAIWLLLGTALALAYRSTLLASLVSVDFEEPVDTWQELLEHDYTVFMAKGTMLSHMFQTSPRAVVRRTFEELTLAKDGLVSVHRGLPLRVDNALKQGWGAYFVEDSGLYGRRHFMIKSKDTLMENYAGFYHSIGHPLGPAFKEGALRLAQAGIINKIADKHLWKRAKPERDYQRGGGSDLSNTRPALGARHLLAIWLLLGAGLAASTLAFLLEKASRRLGRTASGRVATDVDVITVAGK